MDASVCVQSKLAVGGYAVYSGDNLLGNKCYDLKEGLSSTWAEYGNLLKCYEELFPLGINAVYTDCHGMYELLSGQRDRSTAENHKNLGTLYKAVLSWHDKMGKPTVHWIKGHNNRLQKEHSVHVVYDQFSKVDIEVRRRLRENRKA